MSRDHKVRFASRFVTVTLLAVAALVSFWGLPRPAEAGGGCRGEPVTTGNTTSVQIGEAPCFTPTIIRAHPGDSVTWTNEGSLPHTVTGANASWGDYSELLNGQSVSHTFDAAGSYPYYCLLHPGMVGAVVVTDDAQTARAEPVSLNRSSVDGPALSRAAAANAHGDDGRALTALLAAGVVAVAATAGLGGFGLGRRRRSG